MTRPSLAGIEQRAASATAGPWFQGRNGRPYESTCDVYSKREPDEPDSHDIATYMHSDEDAAFIANARTAVPALTAAVRDVLALHQPCDNDVARTPICQACRGRAGVWECGCWADEDRQPVCSSCTDSDPLGRVTPSAYPCPTVRAIATHLDLTDPEGDPT